MATDFIVNADTSPAIAALNKLFDKLEQTEKKFSASFDKMNQAATALTASLIASGYAAMEFADMITDMAKANQLAVGEVLALSEALAQNGGHADSAANILQKFSNAIEGANSGNLGLVTTFGKLGVSIDDLGNLSNSALKDKLLDNLAKIKDPVERNALAVQIFGKAITGVDIAKFAEDQKKGREEMEKYAPALNQAGDAWDKLGLLAQQAKIAFTVAFEPIFRAINALNPDVDSLVIKFRIMASVLAVLTGAAVIRGLLAIRTAIIAINTAMAANPFIAIAGALTALGTYAALTFGASDATKELEKDNKDNTDAVEGTKRSQQGLNDAIKKEKDQLTQIRENLEKNWKLTLDKYDLEAKQLSLNEDEKRVAQEIAKIDEDAYNAKFQLQQKFDAMDTDARARNKKNHEDELKAIDESAAKQKTAAEARLKYLADYSAMVKTFQAISQQGADAEQKMFEAQAKFRVDNSGYKEKIEYETKLNEVQSIRTGLMGNLSKLSETERAGAVQAISDATDNVNLLDESYQNVGKSIRESIELSVKLGQISQESATKLLQGFDKNFATIAAGSEALSNTNKGLAEQSRTFSSGWNKAFREYIDNAENAADQAKRVFQSMTTAMEDLLYNFFKTGKLGWKGFIQTVMDTLLRSQIQQLVAKIMAPTATGGGGGGLFGGSIIPGFLADGGAANAGTPYIVGERGPELFVPNNSGTVIPNGGLGGTSVTYNINAVDAHSFKTMLARDPAFLYSVTQLGAKSIPGRI